MKKFVLAAVVVASVSGLGVVREGLADEVTRHRVKQGDTLWDLSGGYLDDPLLWPKIWKMNRSIANPHRIYPGQVVRIPVVVFPPQQGAVPEKSAAVEPDLDLLARQRGVSGQPLALKLPEQQVPAGAGQGAGADDAELARQYDRGIGMITWDIPGAGQVLGTAQGWSRAAAGEIVQVNAPGARPGQLFGVYRDKGKVPPRTFLGESPGHLLAEIAIVEMVSTTAGQQAVVRRSFAGLEAGDLLGPVPEQPVVAPIPPSQATPLVSGTVVAIHHSRQLAGAGDIVYMDMGLNQGLVPGLRLSVRSADRSESTRTAGEIMVLRVSADRAAALVTEKSNHEVRPGDQVGPAL